MIFSIRKLFRSKRSHKRLRDADYSWIFLSLKMLKRSIARMFAVGDRMALRGFTLIELLVAMLISTLIISTLLAFTVNVMETDRREQAKVESQGEVQAALNYISDDLQESVYIYNSDSLTRISTDPVPGIKDQLPAFTDSTPVLVFWKRIYYAPTDLVNVGGSNTKAVGCLEYGTSTTNGTCNPLNPIGSGRYTYSLVAYYLIYDQDTTWSNAARLGRWEIKDGIRATCQSDYITTPTACSDPKPISRTDVTSSTNTPSSGVNFVNYWSTPDAGFRPFDAAGGTVDFLMNKWTKSGAVAYAANNIPTVLLDLIDDSPYAADQDDGTFGNTPTGNAAVDIPIRPNVVVAGATTNTDCLGESVGVGGTSSAATQRIPGAFQTASANKAENLSSFYVCVNSTANVARIYLRGNALARLRPTQESQRRIVDQTYLTTGNIRAFGRGKLFFQ